MSRGAIDCFNGNKGPPPMRTSAPSVTFSDAKEPHAIASITHDESEFSSSLPGHRVMIFLTVVQNVVSHHGC